jgi:hypothetical protein
MKCRMAHVVFLSLILLPVFVRADDWPQWRGPERNGVSKETGLLKEWPKEGPKLLWKQTHVGGGYSTPAIVGELIYLMADRQRDEFVVALSVKDGTEIWATRAGKLGPNVIPQFPGARSTPTVDGDRIYALGSDGDLVCLDKEKGKLIWSKHLVKDFAGISGSWAYSESVLIDGEQLICTPGGAKATLAALKKSDGTTIWTCAVPEGDKAAYASPMILEVEGVRQYVQFVDKGVVAADARTGKFLWRYNKTKDQAANIPTAVVRDGSVFTSSNGSGLTRVKVTGDAVASEEVYFNTTKLNSIGGVVLVGDYLYGAGPNDELVCMEFKTGTVKWHVPSVGPAALCYADGMLYVRGQGGTGFPPEKPSFVALVEATPDSYKEKGRFEQPDHGKKPAWPHPVVANGRLYLRDGNVLLCYDVSAAK